MKAIKTDLTLENFIEKKYDISPDFRAYRHNEKGKIEDLGSVNDDTLKQIGDYIKEQFFKEVDRMAGEWQEGFIAGYQTHPNKNSLHQKEMETVSQILRGEKSTIIDAFGVTHEIVSYLNGMPVVVGDEWMKLSPVISLYKSEIIEVRKYMVNEYNRPKPFDEYIHNPHYYYFSRCWILAGALMKYQIFLRGYSGYEKSDSKEYESRTRARAFCIMEMYKNGKIAPGAIGSKKKIFEIVEAMFPGQSGKTVYKALKLKTETEPGVYNNGIYHDHEALKNKYRMDYEYGLKLYKEKYPD
jgi:hypothetical protein